MEENLISLSEAFNIKEPTLAALVGGGGKTSLMKALGDSLGPGVVLTVTTRLSRAEIESMAEIIELRSPDSPQDDDGENELSIGSPHFLETLQRLISTSIKRSGSCLVVGEPIGDKVSGIPVELPARLLSLEGVRHVLVEADGSRSRPCKVPGLHEPLIPGDASLVIPVAGVEAIGRTVLDAVHRPERAVVLLGLEAYEVISAGHLARLLTHPEGGLKSIPEKATVIPFLNKVETVERLKAARKTAREILREKRMERVVIGAIKSQQPVREVHRRVTAIVLAAGESSRMRELKQLMTWQGNTILGQTIENLQGSAVNDIVVVSGFRAQAIETEAAAHGVSTIYNPQYAEGEMLSSLKVALENLPESCAAVLVVLADQPMVQSNVYDRILEAFWELRSELIAPAFMGRRGNPVLFSRNFFPQLLALPDGSAPRELVKRASDQLFLVEVGSEAILYDIDDEGDYRRWHPLP